MTHFTPFPILIAAVTALLPALLLANEPAFTPAQLDHFETHVRPLLAERCFECHGPDQQKDGLRLDTRAAILAGGDSGPIVTPGDPAKSLLLTSTHADADSRMPKKGTPLTAAETEHLARWIRDGLAWPANDGPALDRHQRAETHWAFQPVKAPKLPADTDHLHPIDALLHAARAEHAPTIQSAPPADARTIATRLHVTLTGLRPTFDDLAAFEKKPDVPALIDRLLASPTHGQHLARTWLDLARYADTKGYVLKENRDYPYAYTYRDWVIDALNRDLPYDQFLRLQIAADRIVPAHPPPDDLAHPDLAALGFLTVGRRFINNIHNIIDDRIDVITRGTMGLTLACARCHDHPYDPIPTEDYYALYGVFRSTNEPKVLPLLAPLADTPEALAFKATVEKKATAIHDFLTEKNPDYKRPKNLLEFHHPKLTKLESNEYRKRKRKFDEFVATSPHAPPRAMVLVDNKQAHDATIFIRGNAQNRGDRVPRQLPEIFRNLQPTPFKNGSGRLEFAKAITHPKNPLTARVLVNRIWMHHFGEPLVDTPSDFGLRAPRSRHADLLDHIAAAFMKNGWSLKWLHKYLLTSRTYQQAHRPHPDDPANRWFASARVHRLTLEEMRDNLLRAADRLDATHGGKASDLLDAPFTTRRAVYGFIERQNLPGFFRVFDLASPDVHTPRRARTTSPQQALFALNAPFVREQAEHLATSTADLPPPKRVRQLTRAILARDPSPAEAKDFAAFATRISGGVLPIVHWTYGYGKWSETNGTDFTALPAFHDDGYQGGPKLPDPKLNYCLLNETGGHPGDNPDQHAIRRWTAPAAGTITITSTARLPNEKSDGVHFEIVSSQHGRLATLHVPGGKKKPFNAKTTVQPGDTIDFIASMGETRQFDAFEWAPVIQLAGRDHNAQTDFAPPPVPSPDGWTLLAQTLLASNEFFFVH